MATRQRLSENEINRVFRELDLDSEEKRTSQAVAPLRPTEDTPRMFFVTKLSGDTKNLMTKKEDHA